MNKVDDTIKKNLENSSKASAILSYLNSHPHLMEYIKQSRMRIALGDNYPGVTLTERKAFCALYVIWGLTSKEIGKKMDISHRTVEAYISSIKQKLKVKTRSSLVNALFQSDFIDNMIVATSYYV